MLRPSFDSEVKLRDQPEVRSELLPGQAVVL
jgi:hypothetical protein